jgi:hypothetical protein
MSTSLLPSVASALKGEKPITLAEGLQEGDLLHLKAPLLGRPKGTVLPVLGYCLCFDAQGQPYALRAYVPLCPAQGTTYAGREASRFPEPGQRERAGWVGCRCASRSLTSPTTPTSWPWSAAARAS